MPPGQVGLASLTGRMTAAAQFKVLDDADGAAGQNKQADETVCFAVDGMDYEIDLSAKNAAAPGKLRALYRARP